VELTRNFVFTLHFVIGVFALIFLLFGYLDEMRKRLFPFVGGVFYSYVLKNIEIIYE